MEDNISILDNMSMTAEWQGCAENAVSNALALYSIVCHKFEKDKKYGISFVQKNQELMGQLTIAASKLMRKTITT